MRAPSAPPGQGPCRGRRRRHRRSCRGRNFPSPPPPFAGAAGPAPAPPTPDPSGGARPPSRRPHLRSRQTPAAPHRSCPAHISPAAQPRGSPHTPEPPGRAAARGIPGVVVPQARSDPGRRATANYNPQRAPRERVSAREAAHAQSSQKSFR